MFWKQKNRQVVKFRKELTLERFSITFPSNYKCELVPHDQVSPLLVVYCSLFLHRRLVVSRNFLRELFWADFICSFSILRNSQLESNVCPLPYNIVKLKGTGSRLSACWSIKLLLSNLLLFLSVNNPTYMHLSDLRLYFKVELY